MTAFEDLILRDTRANQPAAGKPGRLYYVTDEQILERDNGASWDNVEAGVAGETALPALAFFGLQLSNAADANNDITVGVGGCRDDANAYNMRLGTAIIKQLDASWAAGNNAGGLDTGAEANSTWYHMFLIRKDSDGSIDALFSASFASPTMPAGYSSKRYVGSVRNNASGNIRPFVQTGNVVEWSDSTIANDIDATISTSRSTHTILVPTGLKVKAHLNVVISHGTQRPAAYICDPDVPDLAPTQFGVYPIGSFGISLVGSGATAGGLVHIMTDASSQICSRSSQTSTGIKGATLGWEYLRQV